MPSDKNHVDSFETDGSLPDLPSRLGNLFDLSILEMKCALFDLGIPIEVLIPKGTQENCIVEFRLSLD